MSINQLQIVQDGEELDVRHKQASLKDFLEVCKSKETVHVLNFLDIPMAHVFALPPRLVSGPEYTLSACSDKSEKLT
jgi:hypothetical protein